MAPATNWLSFSLSPMEMLRSSSSPSDHHHHQQHQSQFIPYEGSSTTNHYFLDNFYANGWSTNPKEVGEASLLTSFMDPSESHAQTHHAPKLEDFLGDNSCQTEATQDDSSLTHIYDHQSHHGPASVVSYFHSDPQDLKAIAGFQAFSANSGSEVDDSASIVRAHPQLVGGAEFVGAGHSIESVRSEREFGFGNGTCTGATNGLSLGVSGISNNTNNNINASDKYNNNNNNNNNNNTKNSYNSPQVPADKAIVVSGVEDSSDCSKKIVDTFGQRTSIYRGVTRHRWTGRYEAHLWDNSCRREGQARKGRQVYLGGYDKEDKAARAYDLAALKYWGPTATTNFPVSNYSKELEEMKYVTKQEFIASLRRKSSGFSRGASIYRGVTRHHQQGRWQARIGRVAGNKDLYLGTFATEEEAAEAYDIAAIKFRGLNAVTNFEMNRYDVEAIMKSALPIGGAAKRLKLSLESEQKPVVSLDQQPECSSNSSSNISFGSMQQMSGIPCGIPYDTTTAFYHHSLFHHYQQNNNVLVSTSDAPGCPSAMAAPQMGMVPQTADFFVWPPHQSY